MRTRRCLLFIEPARILEGPQDTKTICGEDIVLFCKASGNPDPKVAFQRNGIEIGESSEVQGLVVRPVGPNALTLRMKVQMINDGDVITCQVHNHFGMDSAKATITVYDANEREFANSSYSFRQRNVIRSIVFCMRFDSV
ncbi:unnamed protein product [Dibothriocephalus latus]|uniref:Ig-like domain-containing protein n=1 Tax=Dibothriocephalus latus TaxID=60516 RepID=A0A3P6TTK5_DIBLA|nr:unnamed protein product [Dibothriocephalus latus]